MASHYREVELTEAVRVYGESNAASLPHLTVRATTANGHPIGGRDDAVNKESSSMIGLISAPAGAIC
jgi:hypothetical protein